MNEKGETALKAKMRWMTSIISILSLLIIAAACSSGGTQNGTPTSGDDGKAQTNSANTPKGSTPSDSGNDSGDGSNEKELYTFTYYSHYDWATTNPWGEDPITEWIIENIKVKLEPIQSGGAAEAKLNTMIASNDLPDMMQMDRGPGVERLRAAGALVALDEYLENSPNLMEQIGEDTLNMLRSPDGKLYQIPNWYTQTPNGNSGWMINDKIYRELGSPKLETFDDLYAYLKLVKDRYPDVIPLEIDTNGFGFGIIYSGFKEETPPVLLGNHVFVDGNELKPIFEDPKYREAMMYTSKLFRERLISQDALSQTPDQMKEKLNTGRVAVFVGGDTANTGMSAHRELVQQDPDNGYTAIWPIHQAGLNPDRITPNGWNSLGWNVNVITQEAQHPERIVEYLDWVVSHEGQRVLVWGPPGLFWDEVDDDGHPLLKDNWATTSAQEKADMRLGSYNMAGNTSFVDPAKVKLEMALPEEARNWATVSQANVFWKTSKNVTEFVNLAPASDSPEGIANQAVKDIYTSTFAKAIFAEDDSDVQKLLDEGNDNMKKVGMDDVLTYMTGVWNENKKLLGL